VITNPFKNIDERISRLERGFISDANALINQGRQIVALEMQQKQLASAETVRWCVAEITRLEEQLKAMMPKDATIQRHGEYIRQNAETIQKQGAKIAELEKRTAAPMGLEPMPARVWEAVLQLVERNGGQITTAQVAREMGVGCSIASARLYYLVRKGCLRKVSTGVFEIPGKAGYGDHPSRILARSVGQSA
jgi:hypothetical protein